MVSTFQPQEPTPRVVLASAVALMVHYFGIQEVDAWTEVLVLAGRYSPDWVRLAMVEALYQGRYKVVSVKQILDIWQRRGKVVSHFNREFEAIVTVPLPEGIQAQLRTIAQAHQTAHVQSRQSQEIRSAVTEIEEEPPTVQWAEPEGNTNSADSESLSTPLIFSEISPIVPTKTIEKFPIMTLDHVPTNHVPTNHPPTNQSDLSPHSADNLPEDNLPHEMAAPSSSQNHAGQPYADLASDPSSPLISPTLLNGETNSFSSSSNPLKPLLSFHRHPIHIDRFCPTPDPSGFDRKLLALANQG